MTDSSPYFHFSITGLPGSASAFWSIVCSVANLSHCYHEHFGRDLEHTLPVHYWGNSSSGILLGLEEEGDRSVLIDRDRDECFESFTRRFSSVDYHQAVMLFDVLERRVELFKHTPHEDRLVVPYERPFSADTIGLVYRFCTGNSLYIAEAERFAKMKIMTSEEKPNLQVADKLQWAAVN